MRVLVLGGTGAMGKYLVKSLSKNGIEIFVTSRSYKKSSMYLSYLHGNAKDFEFIEEILFKKWDAIVDFMVYSTDEFNNRINLFLDATSQYVFFSSARVYANSDQPITEDSPRLLDVSADNEFLSTDEYSLAKARQEDILRNSGRSNWTIVRPYITYSDRRLQLGILEKEDWLYRALNGRTVVFSKDIITKTTTLTYGSDVSQGIMSVIGNSNALGETFHITTNEPISWNEVLKIYLEVIEKNINIKPKVLLLDFNQFFSIHPSKYQIIYDRLYNRRFDSSKIAKYIELNTFFRVDEGIRMCLAQFLLNPKFKSINWKAEALKDKFTNEHTPLKEIRGIKQKIKYIIYRYFI